MFIDFGSENFNRKIRKERLIELEYQKGERKKNYEAEMRKRARHREKMARKAVVAEAPNSNDSSCDSNRFGISNADSINLITNLRT